MDGVTASPLTDLLTRKESWYLMAGAFIVVQTISRFLPDKVYNSAWFARVQPLFPIILCSAGIWIPGLASAGATIAERILTGLILGYVVSHSYKVLLQSALGKDERIAAAKERRKAARAAAPAPNKP